MDGNTFDRVEGVLPETVTSTPITTTVIVVFWIVYAGEAFVLERYGPELAMTLFRVRPDRLLNVWTWFTATFAHVSLTHLVINSYAGFLLGGWAEDALGVPRYLGTFVVGGAITAVGGTLLVEATSGHLLADLGIVAGTTAPENVLGAEVHGAAGASMGLAVVFGALMGRDPTGRATIVGLGLRPRRWLLYASAVAISLAGTLTSVSVFAATIGHPYHLIGLIVGGAYGVQLDPETG